VKRGPEAEGVAPFLVERGGAVALRVRVQPRASREEVVGVREGALVVRLTAPPVDGAANTALTRLLGKRLGVPPSAVVIAAGSTGRSKLVVVNGLSAALARARLEVDPAGFRGGKG
jgi:uncharacterized protein